AGFRGERKRGSHIVWRRTRRQWRSGNRLIFGLGPIANAGFQKRLAEPLGEGTETSRESRKIALHAKFRVERHERADRRSRFFWPVVQRERDHKQLVPRRVSTVVANAADCGLGRLAILAVGEIGHRRPAAIRANHWV